MSHRIFINTQNEAYRRITNNTKGYQFGLGVPTELDSQERAEVQQKIYEIYFSADELREKRRKLQILLDSFLSSAFFSDGSVKPDIVSKYIDNIRAEFERVSQGNNALLNTATGATTVGLGAIGTYAALGNAATTFTVTQGAALSGATTFGGGFASGFLGALPWASAIGAVLYIANTLKARKQEGREDDAAPWRMTELDFPNITSQAYANSSNKRSIERLYDSRKEIDIQTKSKQVPTQQAIALLVREALADALFCKSTAPGTRAITPAEHPGPGGNGTAEGWRSKDALARHFPFKHLDGVPDVNEQTYVAAVLYLQSYITLITSILDLKDVTLSRTPDTEQATVRATIRINLKTETVPLYNAMTVAAKQLVAEKVFTFFDEYRELKTLLNLGDDTQYVVESWRKSPKNENSIQLKLVSPLADNVKLYQSTFISAELAKTVIDNFEFELQEQPDRTPYLRPANIDGTRSANRNYITNVTLNSLGMATGSTGVLVNDTISYENLIFRRWYTSDFNSSELNIDFTDYKNFVHFGSAYNRLIAFANKLLKIEEIDSYISASALTANVGASLKSLEKEQIIRNFDPYERFLFYTTESVAYSASAYYVDDKVEYNPTGSWPKQPDGTPYSPLSGVVTGSWFIDQGAIAQRYDEYNQNYLQKHLPEHIREDELSADFITFVSMVGHVVDNIKVYVDQFPYIYSTNPNPLKDLSMDMVYEVAKSFGLKLPNPYALESLQGFTSTSGSREVVSETWKRFLHNCIYLYKNKGTRTSFDALLNIYGLNSQFIQLKETAYPVGGNYVSSDELTYGISFVSSSNTSIAVPFVTSSMSASSLQLRFLPSTRQTSTLLGSYNNWSLTLVPHPSASSADDIVLRNAGSVRTISKSNKVKYGKIHITSGSAQTIIASSSYFPLFSDDYTNIMLRSQSQDLVIVQTDGDQILYQESASVNLSNMWNTTNYVYIGQSGSVNSTNFDGIVDEIRVWGENISIDNFVSQSYDPGSYYGQNYTSSYQSLYVHIPFSQPLSSITQSATNESPYINISTIPTCTTNGFTTSSFVRLLRTVKQFTPIVGTTSYTNKKVNVVPPPSFDTLFVDNNGTKTLRFDRSIKSIQDKIYTSGLNIVSVGLSPTDFINQTIMRSMGVVDVNNLIGSPRYFTPRSYAYTNLDNLRYTFSKYYNKTINPNEYTKFFKNVTKAITEISETSVPARAKLFDGIIIESPVLSRNKDYIIRSVQIDGQNTKTLDQYMSGSSSVAYAGTFTFDAVYDIPSERTVSGDTLGQVSGAIGNIARPLSSTPSTKIPPAKVAYQYLNVTSVDDLTNAQAATSSIDDSRSGFSYLEAFSVEVGLKNGEVTSSGYPRNPYYGIPSSGSLPARIPGEENTLTPFYDIPPRADFSDVGTTTYFHKDNGKYAYNIYTTYKKEYIAILDTDVDSSLDRLYAKITLLDSGSIPSKPKRDIGTIPARTYSPMGQSNSNLVGSIRTANIFSLYGVSGTSGLRVRLYRNITDLQNDVNRSFSTAPSINSGVLFDTVLGAITDVFPYTLVDTEDSIIYYNIDNTTGNTITSDINLYYFAYEPANLVPLGYLPRHYRFSRENNTAIKRRNYVGTKYTDTPVPAGCPAYWDTCPPWQVKKTETNTITVTGGSSTSGATSGGPATQPVTPPPPRDDSGIGGGGTLNVT